jgi:hypothetical protein
MTLDIGSDGSIERTINSGFSANNAVYIDPGTTQLVGGQDLFGTDTTFAFGVFLPDGAFADVKNLAGQSAFSLNNLNSSSFSFLNSGDFALGSLGLDSFTFAIVPLPTPVAMTGLGLIAAGLVARRRAKRLG